MKIVLMTSEFSPVHGGIGTYALEIANAAGLAGHSVVVVAPDYGVSSVDEMHWPLFRVERFRGGRHNSMGALAKLMLVWQLSFRHSDADVVHAVDWPFYIPLALSPFRVRATCVATFHGTEINFMRSAFRRLALNIARFWNGWFIAVTNSRYTTDLLTRSFPGARELPIRTIPLGVRMPDGIMNKGAARAKLELEGCDLILLTVGRVVPRKGHHFLARALALLSPEIARRITWLVCGPTDDAVYVQQVQSVIATGMVRAHFTGAVPRAVVDAAFSASDLFCLSAQPGLNGEVEGFGLVFLEAASFALPSVGTNTGGIPDAIASNVSGQLVPVDDEAELARTIEGLLRNDDERLRLAQSALAYAREQSWLRVANLTYDL
jgi:glycosyltransferase involved in cell wall biosynthesis